MGHDGFLPHSLCDRIPYAYLVGWSNHNTWYYGARWAKNCHPNELWVKYKTSSNYVKQFAEEYGEPDIIQIRKVFDGIDQCRYWEHKVLKRMNAVKRADFLNKTDNKSIRSLNGGNKGGYKWSEESKLKVTGKNNHFYGKDHTEEFKKNHSLRHTGFKHSNKNIQLFSEINSGSNNAMFGKFGADHPAYGHKKSEDFKTNMSKRFSGNQNPMYGKDFTPEHRLKLSKANSGKCNGRYDPTIREWSHPDYGTFVGTTYEFVNNFVDQKLSSNYLRGIIKNQRKTYRGWILVSTNEDKLIYENS